MNNHFYFKFSDFHLMFVHLATRLTNNFAHTDNSVLASALQPHRGQRTCHVTHLQRLSLHINVLLLGGQKPQSVLTGE